MSLSGVLRAIKIIIGSTFFCIVVIESFPELDNDKRLTTEKVRTFSKNGEKPRIFYGDDARTGEFPYVVAIIKNPPFGKGDQQCGGTLIAHEIVLTACHCLVRSRRNDYTIDIPQWLIRASSVEIMAGSVELSNYTLKLRRRAFAVRVHPKCARSSTRIEFDFGVVVLGVKYYTLPGYVGQLYFSDYRKRALVNEMTEAKAMCLTMGWGLDDKQKYPNILKKIEVQLMPAQWCSDTIYNMTKDQAEGADEFLSESQICAVATGVNRTICGGDSGGPLVCDKDGKKVFVGVVSYGILGLPACGKDKIPGGYARVDAAYSWITKNIFQAFSRSSKFTAKCIATILAAFIAINLTSPYT